MLIALLLLSSGIMTCPKVFSTHNIRYLQYKSYQPPLRTMGIQGPISGPGVPEGYASQKVNGFVEELVVNDDPEYQWIDKIRTPRHGCQMAIAKF